MKTLLLTVTLTLSTYAQARQYICPLDENAGQQCVLESTALSPEYSAVDTKLHSLRITKQINDVLIKYEKNIPQRLNYNSDKHVATPVQRSVIVGKRIPKLRPAALAVADNSRYVAFVYATKACLESDDTGVPIRQTPGCDTVRANAMKYTLLTFAVMTGRSLQTVVDLINSNPAVQEDLVNTLRTKDELPEKAWDAHYKHQISGRVSKFNAFDYPVIIDTYTNKYGGQSLRP